MSFAQMHCSFYSLRLVSLSICCHTRPMSSLVSITVETAQTGPDKGCAQQKTLKIHSFPIALYNYQILGSISCRGNCFHANCNEELFSALIPSTNAPYNTPVYMAVQRLSPPPPLAQFLSAEHIPKASYTPSQPPTRPPAVSAVPPRVILNRLSKLGLPKIRKAFPAEVQLRVGHVPQQEVTYPLLAAGPYQ